MVMSLTCLATGPAEPQPEHDVGEDPCVMTLASKTSWSAELRQHGPRTDARRPVAGQPASGAVTAAIAHQTFGGTRTK